MKREIKKINIFFTAFLAILGLFYGSITQAKISSNESTIPMYDADKIFFLAQTYSVMLDGSYLDSAPQYLTGTCYQSYSSNFMPENIQILLYPTRVAHPQNPEQKVPQLLFYGTYNNNNNEVPFNSLEEAIDSLIYSDNDAHVEGLLNHSGATNVDLKRWAIRDMNNPESVLWFLGMKDDTLLTSGITVAIRYQLFLIRDLNNDFRFVLLNTTSDTSGYGSACEIGIYNFETKETNYKISLSLSTK